MLAKVIKITLIHIQLYAERIGNICLFIYLKYFLYFTFNTFSLKNANLAAILDFENNILAKYSKSIWPLSDHKQKKF